LPCSRRETLSTRCRSWEPASSSTGHAALSSWFLTALGTFCTLAERPGVGVEFWLVIRAGAMAWWPGDFLRCEWCLPTTSAPGEGPWTALSLDNPAARLHYPLMRLHVKRPMEALGGRKVCVLGAPWLPELLRASEVEQQPSPDGPHAFRDTAAARLRARMASDPLDNLLR